MQSTFKINAQLEKGEKEITVRMQEIGRLEMADMTSECTNYKTGTIKTGSFIRMCIENNVIISPKNLEEVLNLADNGIELTTQVFAEVLNFLKSPRLYEARKAETKSIEQTKDVENNI